MITHTCIVRGLLLLALFAQVGTSQSSPTRADRLVARRDSLLQLLRALEDSIAANTAPTPSDTVFVGIADGGGTLATIPGEEGKYVERGTRLRVIGAEEADGRLYWIVRHQDGHAYFISDLQLDFFRRDEARAFFSRPRSRPLLYVRGISAFAPNSAQGVGVELFVRNQDATRSIKYLTVTVVPFNAVGDAVSSTVGGASAQPLRITGPIAPSREATAFSWDVVWYNGTITCLTITRIDVEYMDGSRYTYARELPSVFSPTVRRSCAPPG